jgi:hypothetical protein
MSFHFFSVYFYVFADNNLFNCALSPKHEVSLGVFADDAQYNTKTRCYKDMAKFQFTVLAPALSHASCFLRKLGVTENLGIWASICILPPLRLVYCRPHNKCVLYISPVVQLFSGLSTVSCQLLAVSC